jgi:hypothetical protein
MISLTNMDPINTAASAADALLEVGITQEGQSAKTAAARLAGAAKMEAQLDGTSLGARPRLSLNPLQVGPVSAPNYIQPNTGSPAAGASVQIENNKNPLNITGPQTRYTQPGTSNPPAPVSGQLSTMSYGSIGTSKITHADGTVTST